MIEEEKENDPSIKCWDGKAINTTSFLKALVTDKGVNAGNLMPQTMPIKRPSCPFAIIPPPSLQDNKVFVPISEEEYNELLKPSNGALQSSR